MEKITTKQRILSEALNLFSKKGYEAVSVAEIAEAVGIKAPSLYKHYKSKQDIFDAIISEMALRYEKQTGSMQMNGMEADRDVELFKGISEEQLLDMGKGLFLYFLHDEYVCKFRRMLNIEQYNSRELSSMYVSQYVDAPLAYQGMLFGILMQAGVFVQENPNITALHFYAPMYLLLTMCDCNPQREEEALELVEKHIRQFNRIYCIRE